MAWLLKNAVGGLLLPPCNLLLVQLAGLVVYRKHRRLGLVLIAGSCAGLFICSMPGTAVQAIGAVEWSVPALHLEDPALASRADAIVVLGGGRIQNAQEYSGQDAASPASLMRLRYGMEIKRKTGKPVLLTGGSPGHRGSTEAGLMAQAMREDYGATPDFIEDRADNTAENAEFSYQILSAKGIRRIFLVTQAWHMPRAERAFKSVGFTVVAAPMDYQSDQGGGGSILSWIPSAVGLQMTYLAMHEGIGAVWYRIRGVD